MQERNWLLQQSEETSDLLRPPRSATSVAGDVVFGQAIILPFDETIVGPSRDAVGKRLGTRRNSSDTIGVRERMRRQKTFRHTIGCVGVGLHSGARVGLTLRPADPGFGIRFRRVDRPGSAPIPARLDHVVETPGVTSLGNGATPRVRMIEHLMAALALCQIDNSLIDLSGPELPIMDGSALPFVLLIECAGTVEQSAPVSQLELLRPIAVTDGHRQARLEPARGLHLTIMGGPGAAAFELAVSPEAGRRELAGAREDACRGASGSADEYVRHTALDALGDMALLSANLQARYLATEADAGLRRQLLRRLLEERDAWRLTGSATLGLDSPTLRQPFAC